MFNSIRGARSVRRAVVSVRSWLGPITQGATVLFVGTLILGPMGLFGFTPWASVIWGMLSVTAGAFAAWWVAHLNEKNALFIEFTTGYLIHGEYSLIDRLLGRLISGRWKRSEIRPGDALFRVLEKVCQSGDYWKRRRVSEALPMLGNLDLARTRRLIKKLRNDWDDVRWKSDLRRRAIEALLVDGRGQIEPLLHLLSVNEIRDLLSLRERDEAYTAIAVAEVLAAWKELQPTVVAPLEIKFDDFCRNEYGRDEVDGIQDLRILLLTSHDNPPHNVFARLDDMIKSKNIYTRIAATRNVLLIAKQLPDRTLGLMEEVASRKDQSWRHVRRPLAREGAAEFLVSLILNGGPLAERAEKLLRSLVLDDPDEIIRVTIFDKVESLIDDKPALVKALCDEVKEREKASDELRERALLLIEELSDPAGKVEQAA